METAHLHELAAPPRRTHRAQLPDPWLLRLTTALAHVPVLLLGYSGDVLAHNLLLTALLSPASEEGSSFFRYLFLNLLARQRSINWGDFAQAASHPLAEKSGAPPHDSALHALAQTLKASNPQVATWWNDNVVRDYYSGPKRIHLPDAGLLPFDLKTVSAPHAPFQMLIVYTTQPDSPTACIPPILASWESITYRRATMPIERFNASGVIRPDTVSHAVRAGDQLYLGGVIGTDGTEPRLVAGGPAAQAEQALSNLRAVLQASGAELAHVVSVQLFLTDMQDFPVIDAVYSAVFGDLKPARITLGVMQLALGACVEFNCVAHVE